MQPAFKVVANGVNITPVISDRLVSLEYTDQAGVKSDRLVIVLDDRDHRLQIPDRGANVDLWLGYSDGPLVRMGAFVCDEVEVSGPPDQMRISCNAADMTGSIKAPKERSFHGITLGDLAKTIAAENGLQAAVAQALAGVDLGHVDQTESDMQLLTRICADNGGVCKIQDKRLIIAEHAAAKSVSGQDLPAMAVAASDVGGWSATFADRGKYKSVKAYYQDKGAAERKSKTAGNEKPELTLKQTYANAAEAEAAAKSRFRTLDRGKETVTLRQVVGNPNYAAELELTLSGFRSGVDGGDWITTSVSHRLSGAGYTCDIEAERK